MGMPSRVFIAPYFLILCALTPTPPLLCITNGRWSGVFIRWALTPMRAFIRRIALVLRLRNILAARFLAVDWKLPTLRTNAVAHQGPTVNVRYLIRRAHFPPQYFPPGQFPLWASSCIGTSAADTRHFAQHELHTSIQSPPSVWFRKYLKPFP